MRAATWLDDVDPGSLAGGGFGREARAAFDRRRAWLRECGLMHAGVDQLSAGARAHLDGEEFAAIAAAESRRSARRFMQLAPGEAFRGVFERTVDGAARRFVVIGGGDSFTLVLWRKEIDSALGRTLTIRGGKSLGWALGEGRGLSR